MAGTPVVTVAHGALRATYQPAVATADIGFPCRLGTLGSVAAGGNCSDRCLHWGAILNGRYVDPRLLLGHTHVELRPLRDDPQTASLPSWARSCVTALVCNWHARDSVTPRT